MTRPRSDIPIDSVLPATEAEGPLPPSMRQLGGKLTGLTLPQQVFALSLWPFLEQVLNFLVMFVDTALAGRISVEATNAIGVASFAGWLMRLMQMAVAVGSTALVARAVGGRHKRLANAVVGQSIIMAIIIGLISGLVIFAGARPIGYFTNLTGQSLELTLTYLHIIALAAVGSSLLAVATAIMKGAGDTRTPFIIMVIVNLLNIGVSLLLVYGPAPIGGHGVAGIAIGTAVAWSIGALLALYVLVRGWGGVKLHLPRLKPHWHTVRRITRIGMPSFFESMGMWSGNFIVFAIVGLLGKAGAEAVWGAHMVGIRVEAISFMPGFAIGTAAATLAGQYLGLGDPQRARLAVGLCCLIGASIMTVIGFAFILIPEPLVRLVTNEPELLAATPPLLQIIGPVQLFLGSYMILAQALRGAGDTRTTMIMTFSSIYFIRLPAAYLLAITFGLGLNGIWYAMAGELVIRGLLFTARYLHGGWMKVQV